MKILSIGYYDDFARFFLELKKELKSKNRKIDFVYFSLYLSGFIYFILRLHKASFFSFKVFVKQVFNSKKYSQICKSEVTHYKGVDLQKVISYHIFLDPKKSNSYKKQALAYIDFFNEYFTSRKIDLLLLSGDTRMCIEIADFFGKKNDITTYYFEQGPFGTTIWDSKGVNANASLRGELFKACPVKARKFDEVKLFFDRKRSNKYFRNPFYRGSDYVFQYLATLLRIFPIDIKIDKNAKVTNNSYQKLKRDKPKENNFLLILQVPIDVNMTHHSPYFNNHYDIVKTVHQSLPHGYSLSVREHPLYKNRYETSLYDYMLQNKIFLDCDNLYNSLDQATVVVVNNSTVGIEAISRYKKVVCLGNSYYDSSEISLKYTGEDNTPLKELLIAALDYKINEDKVVDFLHHFLYDFLIDGHYRDKNLKATGSISKILISNHDI